MGPGVVDIHFSVSGQTVPWDHCYALFSALCRIQPAFHEADYPLGVFPLNGAAEGRMLRLTGASRLRLRLPEERIGDALTLVGRSFRLQSQQLRLGEPRRIPVVPAARLKAAWVTVKGALRADDVLRQVGLELAQRQLSGQAELVAPARPRSSDCSAIRRTRTIAGASVVGYALVVKGLSVEDALTLCAQGLGGRRHFGGGLFLPARGC